MKVKKYVVDSMPDALQKIRAELGKDAVIINTKEVRIGGFLGMFGKKKVEVVAATDTYADVAPPTRDEGPALATPSRTATIAPPPRRPAPAVQEVRIPAGSAEPAVPNRSAVQTLAKPAPNAVPAAAPSAAVTPVREDALLQEMKQMKEMMRRLAGAQESEAAENGGAPLPDVFRKIRDRLVAQDVLPELAQRLAEDALSSFEGADAGEIDPGEACTAVKEQVVALLTRRPIEQIRPDAKIVHFVGPTGVGKTTTIAKLAAEQTLKFRKQVGLITSDTYRIAAIEQLRTYASILNVPLEVVFSSLDLRKALENLQDKDMILMDTAGRNFRSEMAVSELYSLLRTEERRDTFLVLSLSMKYSDMKAVTDNFVRFGVEKVLFTKADETATFGSVVNLLHDYPIALSYITDGQDVPDDIQAADAGAIADELTGELHDE